MIKRMIALVLLLAFMLCGCAVGNGEETASLSVYRSDAKTKALVVEKIRAPGANELEAIVEALNSSPRSQELRRAFPDSVSIESAELSGGVCRVRVSEGYLSMTELEQLIAESALVLSLSAVDEACSVDIVCGERRCASGLLPEHYIEADGICGEYVRCLKLYLPDSAYEKLVPRSVSCPDGGELPLSEQMLREIFTHIGGGVEDTQIISVSVENGHCRAELSQEFYGTEPASADKGRLIVYSLVNSLCRLPEINSVSIIVEGLDVESYGSFSTSWPMSPDMTLISYQEN